MIRIVCCRLLGLFSSLPSYYSSAESLANFNLRTFKWSQVSSQSGCGVVNDNSKGHSSMCAKKSFTPSSDVNINKVTNEARMLHVINQARHFPDVFSESFISHLCFLPLYQPFCDHFCSIHIKTCVSHCGSCSLWSSVCVNCCCKKLVICYSPLFFRRSNGWIWT